MVRRRESGWNPIGRTHVGNPRKSNWDSHKLWVRPRESAVGNFKHEKKKDQGHYQEWIAWNERARMPCGINIMRKGWALVRDQIEGYALEHNTNTFQSCTCTISKQIFIMVRMEFSMVLFSSCLINLDCAKSFEAQKSAQATQAVIRTSRVGSFAKGGYVYVCWCL